MQGRYRNSNDGFRSGYRNHPRGHRGGGFGRDLNPNPHLTPRKEEILIEAGRLAAEYLIFKGLLPRDSLVSGRDSGRASALDRLGRRQYEEDHDNSRGRKRSGSYGRECGGSDWERRNFNGDDDFAPSYQRGPTRSRSEFTGESASGNKDLAEDTGSKASSSSTKKEIVTESDARLSKIGDSKDEDNLVKSGSNALQDKSAEHIQEVDMEASNTIEVAKDVPVITNGGDRKENHTESSRMEANDNITMEETVQTLPVLTVEEREPSAEDEDSRLDNLRAKQLSSERITMSEEAVAPVVALERAIDKEVVAPVELVEEKPVDNTSSLEVQLDGKLEEKDIFPPSFKICDLNLTGTPEITEIPDDPAVDHVHPPAPSVDTGKELSMDFGLSMSTDYKGTNDYNRLPGDDDKAVQVINLNHDSPGEANASGPSEPKNEQIICPKLDNFLSQAEHVNLPGIQDNYSPALPDFLGTDVSHCPSIPSDLNNLQAGMDLHDPEGVPNDDESIYVSLGEIPIEFMEVWDQPPQDYGKFF